MPNVEIRERAGGEVRYVVRVRDPDPPPGRSGFTSATFATRPEAERFVRDCADRGVGWALATYRRDKAESDEYTLDAWAEIHFKALTKPSPSTVRRYRRIYNANWSPELGHLRLSAIRRVDVAAALNKVTGSDKTVLNAWGVLTHMLKMAAADGLIPRTPTAGVTPPRRTDHEREEHRYLTHSEFWRIYEATPDHWKPLVMTLAGTGMRWGELAALTVGDVDLEHRVIRVTKAEKQDPDMPSRTVVGPTKSRKSRRTVTINDDLVDELRPWIEGRKRSERVFLPPRGGPLRHRTFYRDIWLRKCVPDSGISEPYPRLHDLRHSHVAWLIASNPPTPLPVIQARLGHEKISTTIDTYGHLLPDLQRQAADAAALVLTRPAIES
jgi:integrase